LLLLLLFLDELGQPLVRLELARVHAHAHHAAERLVRRQVRDPARADVEDVGALGQLLVVVLLERRDGPVVDVRDETRGRVELDVRLLVQPAEVFGGIRPLGRKVGRAESGARGRRHRARAAAADERALRGHRGAPRRDGQQRGEHAATANSGLEALCW